MDRAQEATDGPGPPGIIFQLEPPLSASGRRLTASGRSHADGHPMLDEVALERDPTVGHRATVERQRQHPMFDAIGVLDLDLVDSFAVP